MPLSNPIVNIHYSAIFSFLISDLFGVFFNSEPRQEKIHGMGEDEDLTQLVNIFLHSFPSLPSFPSLVTMFSGTLVYETYFRIYLHNHPAW